MQQALSHIRSLLFASFVALLTLFMGVLWLPSLILPRWVSRVGFDLWNRIVLWALKWLGGVDWQVQGLEHLPEGPFLIASKHQSMWDTVALPVLTHDVTFVIKRELLKVPLYGWYCRKFGMIAVDREGHASALREMIAKAKAAAAEGRPIIIFPEGTRGAPGTSGDYKPGAAALYKGLGLPCVPIALNSGLHWHRRGFSLRPGTIRVEILKPIPAGLDRRAFMETLHSRIETASARLLDAGPPSPEQK